MGNVVEKRPIQRAERIVFIHEKEEKKLLDIGCLARPLARCHFPMTNPSCLPNPLQYERRDGDRTITLSASSKYGLPYGSDLLALYGLCTRGRELYKHHGLSWDGTVSFPSTAEMLRYFGDPSTKQYYDRRIQSLLRIWNCQILIEDSLKRHSHKGPFKARYDGFRFLRTVNAWFQIEDRQMGLPFENAIRFTPEMIEYIAEAPLFEDDKVFFLRQSIGALQLYMLLRDRCAQEEIRDKNGWIPVHGPNSLETQLGWVRTPARREVRRQLSEWLNLIRATVWPHCPGQLGQGGDGTWWLKVWYVPPLFNR